ncbi:hypothetical protein HYALB_00010226 [Hymenoscyphus albidus]|uniref:Uncharacterized protein n=1 Tax=Hymenoscyphus albidus TaxID=595503 RepID=A0A9N9LN84_9HELO|nr:hypothetical protein HYALB_00010226 [Hymenoscyphus albidus]
MASVHEPELSSNQDEIRSSLHLRIDLPSTQTPESKAPRSVEVVYSIPVGCDTMKFLNEDVRYHYVLTKVAYVCKPSPKNEEVVEIKDIKPLPLPLAVQYPTKQLQKHWGPSELELDYTALRVIRLETSPSLYPGPRAFVDPESIQAIVCHHAGMSYCQLEQAANTWTSFPAVTHNVYVGLFDEEFGLVLPASLNGTEEKIREQWSCAGANVDAATSTKVPRSDFEASAFMAFMPTWAHKIIKKANPEDLAQRMLPEGVLPSGARFVLACFWAFLCAIDAPYVLTTPLDITEDGACSDCIDTCIESFASATTLQELSLKIKNIWSRSEAENPKLKDTKIVITAFHHAVCSTQLFPENPNENEEWKLHFWHEVGVVVKALQDEKPLHGRRFAMSEWIRLRILTISARPFIVVARAGLGLPTSLPNIYRVSSRISQMEVLTQSILGLQNDLLGWQKDHIEGNPMCCVEILIRNGMGLKEAFAETLGAHNELVRALLAFAELGGTMNGASDDWTTYVKVLVSFCNAMAMWMMVSKRYCHRDNALPVKGIEVAKVDLIEKKPFDVVEIDTVSRIIRFVDEKSEDIVHEILKGLIDEVENKSNEIIKTTEVFDCIS